jgi:signal transduction histidine kinase
MPLADGAEMIEPGADNVPIVSALPDDMIVLANGGGVMLGGGRMFNVSVRLSPPMGVSEGSPRHRSIEIPLLGRDGEISGVLRRDVPFAENSNTVIVAGAKAQRANAGEHVKNIVHDINNQLAVIDSGLRLLGRQSDPRERDLVMGRMREAVARAAVLSRGLLDTAWRR